MSVQTKDVPSALGALLKAKGQSTNQMAIARQPIGVIVENQTTAVPATSVTEPVAPVAPATPELKQEPVNDGRDSAAYRELKAYHDKTVYELRTSKQNLEESLKTATAPKVEAPKTAEELLEFKSQYPDAYDIMRTIALEEAAKDSENIRNQMEQLNRDRAELKEKEAFGKLLEIHPDAYEIKESPKFAAWFVEQPEAIKQILAFGTDYKAISKQLTLYKIEVLGINPLDTKKAKQKEQVDASLGVNVNSHTEITPAKKIWTGTEVRAITGDYKLWNKYSAEIDQARREGRYDPNK